MFIEIFLILGAYLLGSIPVGLWISKGMHGIDPRQAGSGNIGATNIWRVTGRRAAALTLAIDVLKGFLPIGVAFLWDVEQRFILFIGTAAILGHVFPIFLKFKGGKGVAVSLGVFLGLAPHIAFVAFILWLGGAFWGGYSSIGALTAFGMLPLLAFLLKPEWEFVLFSFLLATLVYFRHSENIRRLLRGEEKQVEESRS